jgi:hypothetical protein
MAATELYLLTAPFRTLDLRGIKQGRNDCRRSDAHGDPGLHQLGPPFFVAFVFVAHSILFPCLELRRYAHVVAMGSREVRRCAAG